MPGIVVNFNGKGSSSNLAEDWRDRISKKVMGSRRSISNKFTTSLKHAKERKGTESIMKAVGHIRSSERYKAINARLSCQLQKLSTDAEEESFWKTVASECFGSLFFAMLTGGTTFRVGVHNAVTATALCSGFCQVALMSCFAREAHFNSSVSISLAWAGLAKKRDVFVRIICHFLGNFCGSLVLNRLSSTSDQYIGVSSLNFGVSRSKAFLAELLASLIFALAFLFCYKKHNSGGQFAVGAILTAILLFIIPYTGGCLNPSRSLASALASNFWSNQWIFLSATTLGGILAGCLHKLLTTNLILKSFETFYLFLERRKQVVLPKSESHSVDEVLSSKMSTFSDILDMSSPSYALKTPELYADESDLESSDEEFSPWDALPSLMKAKSINKTVHWSPNIVELTSRTEQQELTEDLNNHKQNPDEEIVTIDFSEPATDSGALTMLGNLKKVSLYVDEKDVVNLEQTANIQYLN